MNHTLVAVISCVFLFFGMLLAGQVAQRIGRRRWSEAEEAQETSGAVTGAVFALLGLLIAFTFSGAYARFDARRQLIVQEANAIGTAYLRLDLLPPEAQAPLRESFREYVASRALQYQHLTNTAAARRDLAGATALQNDIWNQAVVATAGPENQAARMLLLSALNEMIDIVTTRSIAIQTHPPLIIWFALALLALVCAGLAGYAASRSERPSRFYAILFAAITVLILYIILDIEYPRYGFVRLDSVNQLLVDLGKTMR
jgi:hypothetical protein